MAGLSNSEVPYQLFISVITLLIVAFGILFNIWTYRKSRRERYTQILAALCAELEMNARLAHINVLTFRYRLGLMIRDPKSIFVLAPTQFSSSAWNATKVSGLLEPKIFREVGDAYEFMEKTNQLIQLRLSRIQATDATSEEIQMLDIQIAEQTDELVPIIKKTREQLTRYCGSLPDYWSIIGKQLQKKKNPI